MNSQEEDIIKQEKEQIKAYLTAIREENNTIAKRLAGIIGIIKLTRASQVGISLMITDLEDKLKKI